METVNNQGRKSRKRWLLLLIFLLMATGGTFLYQRISGNKLPVTDTTSSSGNANAPGIPGNNLRPDTLANGANANGHGNTAPSNASENPEPGTSSANSNHNTEETSTGNSGPPAPAGAVSKPAGATGGNTREGSVKKQPQPANVPQPTGKESSTGNSDEISNTTADDALTSDEIRRAPIHPVRGGGKNNIGVNGITGRYTDDKVYGHSNHGGSVKFFIRLDRKGRVTDCELKATTNSDLDSMAAKTLRHHVFPASDKDIREGIISVNYNSPDK